jgi:hypothetical protein
MWDVSDGENTRKLTCEISTVVWRSYDIVVLLQLSAFEIDSCTKSIGEQTVGISRCTGRQFTSADRVAAIAGVMASLAAGEGSADMRILSQENLAGRASLSTTFGLAIPVTAFESHV